MVSALNKLANGTIELTITIPVKRVKSAYDIALASLVKGAEIKGFRKGKAPGRLVEEKLDKKVILGEVLKSLIPEVYIEAVKEHNLKPIINPQVQLISTEEGKDWQIKALTCELPEVKLGNYEDEIRKSNASDKIWVPGKDKKDLPAGRQENQKPTEDEKLAKIFKILLSSCTLQIPELLIQEEVNHMLSRLIDQTGRLGLTVEQYLASTGKSIVKIKEEYRLQAEESLKLELILLAIAENKKIQITDAEVAGMIAAAPDKEAQKKLDTPEQKAYIRQILRKRRIIDSLSSL
jgi:trigger factor